MKPFANNTGKRGFTLMELLVYMAIVGIVVVIAGQVFSDSTKMRVRTQSMLKASEIAENVGTLFRDDVSQMGAKSAVASDGSINPLNTVMMAPTGTILDSSSFNYSMHKDADKIYADELLFRRIFYNDAGVYERVEEIHWYVENGVLKRSCQTIAGTKDEAICNGSDDKSVVEITTGVTNFMITPAKPNVTSSSSKLFPSYANASKKDFQLIPYGPVNYYIKTSSTHNSGGSATLSGFTTNFESNGTTPTNPIKHMYCLADDTKAGDSWADCQKFNFDRNKVYEVSFSMNAQEDNSRMFRPGVDHMSLGIRHCKTTTPSLVSGVPDIPFYPPESADGSGTRTMQFTISDEDEDTDDICIAYTFVFYSPTVASGSIIIKDIQVHKNIGTDYTFEDEYEPNANDRKSIRAFRMKLDIQRNKENGHVEMVVPVPSNGTKG